MKLYPQGKGVMMTSEQSGQLRHLKSIGKGVNMGKFKDIPRASEVAHGQAESLEAYDGIELCLDRFELSDTLSFGKKAALFCHDDRDFEVKLFTFSQVVVDQLQGIADKLPCLITIEKHGNYYTIY